MGQAREFPQRPDHRIERVGDANHESIRRMIANSFSNRFHYFQVNPQQIVAAHSRLAGDAGGDDAHICAGDIGIRLRARHIRVKPFGRARFCDIERFAIWNAFCNIE